MKKTDNLQKSAAVLIISAVIVKLIGALFKIPLSSSYGLGDLGFGYFSAAYDFITPVFTLALSGFPVAVARIIADNLSGAETVFLKSKKLLLKLSLPVVICTAIIIVPLSYFSSDSIDGIFAYIAVLPSVVLCFAVSAYRGYFEGREQMTPPAVSNIIEALGKLVLGLLFAVTATKITGNAAIGAAFAIFGIAVGTFVSLLYLHFSCKNSVKNLSVDNKADSDFRKNFLAIAIPIAIAALAPSLVSFIDSLTVRAQISYLNGEYLSYFEQNYPAILIEGLTEKTELPTLLYGIRSKAHTLYNLVPTLTTAIGVAAVPVVSRLFAVGQTDSLKEKIAFVVKFSTFISVPAGVAFLFFGKQIACLLFDVSAISYFMGHILSIYGIAALFIGIAIPLGMLLQGLGQQKEVLKNVCLCLAVKLILNLWLTASAQVNIFGSAISTTAFAVLLFIFNLADLIKCIGFIKTAAFDSIKIIVSTAVCIFVAKLICLMNNSLLVFIFAIFAAVVVYIVVNLLLRTFTKAELKNFNFK